MAAGTMTSLTIVASIAMAMAAANPICWTVTSGTIRIDGNAWGRVEEWKTKYDDAIIDLLAAHESEHALSAL